MCACTYVHTHMYISVNISKIIPKTAETTNLQLMANEYDSCANRLNNNQQIFMNN